jgi:hypothetical protein
MQSSSGRYQSRGSKGFLGGSSCHGWPSISLLNHITLIRDSADWTLSFILFLPHRAKRGRETAREGNAKICNHGNRKEQAHLREIGYQGFSKEY